MLILTASMGGGHLQVSRELARRLGRRGHQVSVADLNTLLPGPTGRWLAAFYPWLVDHAPWLYDVIFRTFFTKRQDHGERAAVPARLAGPALRRLIRGLQPDVVVATYHVAALAAARLRARGELDAPLVTFVTTFGVHELWLHPATDAYLAISPYVANVLADRTTAPVAVCGPVVREGCALATSSAGLAVRRRLNIDDDSPVALVVAGSLGIGPIEDAARVLAQTPRWAPVVVCGHNAALQQRLADGRHGIVLGWVDEMPALMAAANVLVDNAAGLTSKEALAVGLPVVTFRPIAGHGRDDALAMARIGVTEVVDDEVELVAALNRLAEPSAARQQRVARGRALFVGDAADAVEQVLVARRVDPYPRPTPTPVTEPAPKRESEPEPASRPAAS